MLHLFNSNSPLFNNHVTAYLCVHIYIYIYAIQDKLLVLGLYITGTTDDAYIIKDTAGPSIYSSKLAKQGIGPVSIIL